MSSSNVSLTLLHEHDWCMLWTHVLHLTCSSKTHAYLFGTCTKKYECDRRVRDWNMINSSCNFILGKSVVFFFFEKCRLRYILKRIHHGKIRHFLPPLFEHILRYASWFPDDFGTGELGSCHHKREKKLLFTDFFDTQARSCDFRFQVKKETTRRRDGEITAYQAFLFREKNTKRSTG